VKEPVDDSGRTLMALDSGLSDSLKPEGLTLIQPRVQPWVPRANETPSPKRGGPKRKMCSRLN
jgi:hypothetical protein